MEITKELIERNNHFSPYVNICDFSDLCVENLTLTKKEFLNCTFFATEFRQVIFEDCVINFCNLNMSNLSQVTFINCEIINSTFCESSLFNTKFIKCNLYRSDFENALLISDVFEKCDMRSVNMFNITSGDNTFEECNLSNMRFKYEEGTEDEDNNFRIITVDNIGLFNLSVTYSFPNGYVWYDDFEGSLEEFKIFIEKLPMEEFKTKMELQHIAKLFEMN